MKINHIPFPQCWLPKCGETDTGGKPRETQILVLLLSFISFITEFKNMDWCFWPHLSNLVSGTPHSGKPDYMHALISLLPPSGPERVQGSLDPALDLSGLHGGSTKEILHLDQSQQGKMTV